MVSQKGANSKRVGEWRKRQRENPEKHEEYKRKERERYRKRKEKGLLPPISEIGERGQRFKRRHWRENQRSKRQKDREQLTQLNVMVTPPTSPEARAEAIAGSSRQVSAQKLGRKKVRKDRAMAYRNIFKLKVKLQQEQKLKSKYKKRCQRLQKGHSLDLQKRTDALIKKQDYKKTFLVHQAIVSRIKRRYSKTKSQSEKKMISSLICSYKMMRKLHLLTHVRKLTGIGKHYQANKVVGRKQAVRPVRMKNKVAAFLERDDNTRFKAGKKSTITKKGEKRQLRLLNDNIKNLHSKFLAESQDKISYSLFCLLKPFHIHAPTAKDRETCQCKIHENLSFKLEKCRQFNVLPTQDIDTVINSIVCDSNNKECMYRECDLCKERTLAYDLSDGHIQVWWNVWKNSRQERDTSVNGEPNTRTVSITVKEKEYGSLKILSEELQKDIQRATRHIFNIRHQYKALKYLRDRLSHEEIMLHIDFSENFHCKYANEIQSMHFGASQRQISLHTGVAYTQDKTYSFCTMSDCLKHSPAAIWAHLHPVITDLKNRTRASKIHFISDGPTTQYRNKQNFYLFSKNIFKYGFTEASWNFLEAAHGKGAADGIGAVIKRTADDMVNVNGRDVTKASDLMAILQSKTSIDLYCVSESDITRLEDEIPATLKPIPQTMQIHQLTTVNCGIVHHRQLSCFCRKPLSCQCFQPNTTTYYIAENEAQQACTETKKKTSTVCLYDQQLKENATSSKPQQDVETNRLIQVEVVDESLLSKYCVVLYDEYPYPGIILDVNEDEEVEVKVMCKIGFNRYFWPMIDDILWYPKEDIVTILQEPPKPVTKRHHAIDAKIWALIEKKLNL